MAGHAARLRTPHSRVEHIQELTAEIGSQMQVASHLMTVIFKAAYDFLTIACLTAGLIFLGTDRTRQAQIWGGAGIILALLWIASKGALQVLHRAFTALGAELKGTRPAKTIESAAEAIESKASAVVEGRRSEDGNSEHPRDG